MAKSMKQHQQVDETYLADRANCRVLSYDFDVTPEQLWNSLLDADAWTHWLPITKVDWTSPQPFGVGTTRTIYVDKDSVEEYFFGWEDGKRMAFRFEKSTLPISAFAEDYLVEPTEKGARLTWTFRIGAFFLLSPLLYWQLSSGAKKGFPKLEALIKSDPERFS